jgi:NAD(P)H-nitrite reductase large subunit
MMRAALTDTRPLLPEPANEVSPDILCFCEWLSRDELIAAIPYVKDVKELRETTRACTTCFGCEGDLDDLVAEHGHLFGSQVMGHR